MPKGPLYLLDVNVLIALLDEEHIHHRVVSEWFNTPGLQWALCPFTEAGLLRHMTRPNVGDLSMGEATAMLAELTGRPGYHYQPISADWPTLCGEFFKRIFGHRQITDAYLLGLAVRGGMVLATFDRALLYLAAERMKNILILHSK